MSNSLSTSLLAQLYAQDSSDPFLLLVTLSHSSFTTIRLVNNQEDIVSRGMSYIAFPMMITLGEDNNETSRQFKISFDNVSRELIDELRSVIDPIDVSIEMVLATDLDNVQYSVGELKMKSVSYNSTRVEAVLVLDDFLQTEMGDEKYTPLLYPGLF